MGRSEKDKMLAGELYLASDPELVRDRRRCRSLLHEINGQPDEQERHALFRRLLGRIGDGSFVQPPFACDYGSNISIGDRVFINFNAVILDCAEVTIGDGAQIASAVQLLAADHPRDAKTAVLVTVQRERPADRAFGGVIGKEYSLIVAVYRALTPPGDVTSTPDANPALVLACKQALDGGSLAGVDVVWDVDLVDSAEWENRPFGQGMEVSRFGLLVRTSEPQNG